MTLAAIDHDVGVPAALLAALGERDDPQWDPVDQIVDAIGSLDPIDVPPFGASTFVLIVDNAEHLVEPVARLVDAVLARVARPAASRTQVARTHDPNLTALLVSIEATDALLRGTGDEWTTALGDIHRRGERTEAGLTLPVVVTDLLLVLVDQGGRRRGSGGRRCRRRSDRHLRTGVRRSQGIATAVALLSGDVDDVTQRADLTHQASPPTAQAAEERSVSG